jgi:cytidyltransferase-like protein|tara:strand:+ start:5960 stop:6382 length:423 start_codon:yes stop_codon:yes gene_type:complete
MKKATIVSGYFNPIHKGHLELLEIAKGIGDMLIVIVNSDLQRYLKGSKEFQLEEERLTIIKAIKYVDWAMVSVDIDKTQIQSLKEVHAIYGETHVLSFANGGDQNNDTIPESLICKELGIKLIDGLGQKIQSSSWLLDKN